MPADFDIKKPSQPISSPTFQPKTMITRRGGLVSKSPRRSGLPGRAKSGYNYWRIVSQLAFALALLAILGVILHLTILPNNEKVNSYSVYAFFLLLAATISLAFESRDRK